MSYIVRLKKGSSKRMKSTVTSVRQAKRISKAIKTMQLFSIDELTQRGLVKKLNISDRDNIYSFRVGRKERAIFSPVGKGYVIHDIVDLTDKSIKSLTASADK